jgi:hypothetical protein
LLRRGLLWPVYHGGADGVHTLKELARSYLTITKDLTRVMNRIKGLYRSWAIPCTGQAVYSPRYRKCMVAESDEAGGTAPGGVVVSTRSAAIAPRRPAARPYTHYRKIRAG